MISSCKGETEMKQVYLRYIAQSRSGGNLVYGEYLDGFEIVPIGAEFALTFKSRSQNSVRAVMGISMLEEVFDKVDRVFTGELASYSLPGSGPEIELISI
jgi:hypothetical protein